MGLRILDVAMAVPPRVQTAEELAVQIGCPADWIHQHTGVHRRHIAEDHVSPAQLAAVAAKKILQADQAPDLILYAGALSQQLVPETSAFVQRELLLHGVPSFTVNQTCLSFVTAIQVADSLLKSGVYRRILICSGELATRGRSMLEPESASLLGDGAAAAILEYSTDDASCLLHSKLETWSDGIELCVVRAGNHPPPRPEMVHEDLFCFHMQGPQLFRFVRQRLKRFLKAFLEQADCSIDEIQLVVPHQASGPGLRVLPQLGFASERVVNIVGDYGNCVAASIPMALSVAVQEGRIQRGDKVLLFGTAAGVSIGAALLKW